VSGMKALLFGLPLPLNARSTRCRNPRGVGHRRPEADKGMNLLLFRPDSLALCTLLALGQQAVLSDFKKPAPVRFSHSLGVTHCTYPSNDKTLGEFTIAHLWMSLAVLPAVGNTSIDRHRLTAKGFALFYGDETSLAQGTIKSPQIKNAASMVQNYDQYTLELRLVMLMIAAGRPRRNSTIAIETQAVKCRRI
jgi:hypothetical protein